ncbi:hypothetical protein MM221_14600 [Salipaludibacillus sp. LMS25]|jgi:hypothetical protein|uniref:hypothetical protein n=1 Tax=Salipaludibacillus sp. LMS25 TaxID=2924031 RepID=UPI0020D01781|nr:hypothetical protein [Salipaludibacillus sp. LMS25]UTR13832.1 hypothetical protein MM221_14600 [Salipaludibacillus sp. LMS25]
MKNINFFGLSLVLLLISFVSFNTVSAESSGIFSESELKDLENEINEIMNAEFEDLIPTNDNDVYVEVDDISIELEKSTLEFYDYDKEMITNSFKEKAKEIKRDLTGTEVEIIKNEVQNENGIGIQSVIKKKSYYTARVWSGVPAVGWGYINQDFQARNKSGKISGMKLLGSSYDTGVTAGGWTHNRSWFDMHKYAVAADIRMKGVVSYVVKGSPVRTSATFLKTVYPRDLK